MRNVDHYFIISDSKKVSYFLLEKFYSLHSSIIFNKETELNSQILFLIVSIKRNMINLSRWYSENLPSWVNS